MGLFSFNKAPEIRDENIAQEWSQLVLQMGNRGEELLKRIAHKIQELNLPLVTLMREEATLGSSNNRYNFVSVMHEKYPDYKVWIGAIDRMGQLKVSWFLVVKLPNVITAKMRDLNRASRGGKERVLRPGQRLGRMLGAKLSEKITGKPTPVRVRPDELTMDDKEEYGVFMSLIHQATTSSLGEMMNELNLDFTKVDTHTEGFVNLS
ncbi:MAG: hypothetical protein AAB468_00565 [Patescibacteria group bacterium]